MKTMKNIQIKIMSLLAMFFMLSLISCKEKETVITPEFPELKEETHQPGETIDIIFSANLDWTIKSSQAWCKFINGEFTETTASGKASDSNTLKVQITDEGWNYQSNDVAELTLTMMDMSQVIYKITRSKKEYEDLKITDAEGNVYNSQNPLTIKGSGLKDTSADSVYTVVKAIADTQVGLIEYPEWLYVKNTGNGEFKFIFDKGKESVHKVSPIFPINNNDDKIVFATKDYIEGNVETDKIRMIEIPVNYEGLKIDYIGFTDDCEEGRYFNELYASNDGKTFTTKVRNGLTGQIEDGETYQGPLNTTIVTRSNEYEVLVVSQSKETAPNNYDYSVYDFEKNTDWVTISKLNNTLSLTVKQFEEINRGAAVFVFSKAYWESIKTDSVAKYGTLEKALLYKELVYKPDLGEGVEVPEDQCIYTMSVKGEYTNNLWMSVFQEKEEEKSDGVTLVPWYYTNYDGVKEFFTFEQIGGDLPEPKIENITGSEEAELISTDLGTTFKSVWKITCSNSLLRSAEESLAIEAKGMISGQKLAYVETPSGVKFSNVEKDGNTLVTIVAPTYIGKLGLVVMDTVSETMTDYVIIEVTE